MFTAMGSDSVPGFLALLQYVATIAVILVAASAWLALRGSWRTGNRVQIEIDLQVIDLGPGAEFVGELMVVLQNLGVRHQRLRNLFIEIRPSRRAGAAGLPLVPVSNLISKDDFPLLLAPGVRQMVTWSFEIPREERLLRVTALITASRRWLSPETVPELAHKHFWAFGPTARYVSRVFEVSASGFRRV